MISASKSDCPEPEKLYERARQSLAGGISHENRYENPFPIYMKRAKGPYMWDVTGKKYIDFCMGSASLLLGHAHPEIVSAIKSSVEHGTFYANCHTGEIEWAELLAAMIPSAERVRFVASGTEATMLAIRLARAHTGKEEIICFEGHYHGWHDGVTRGLAAPYRDPGTLGALQAAIDMTIVCPADATFVEDILRKRKNVAAIICEPSGSSYGTVPVPNSFLADLRDLSNRYGTVLIFDEIISGFRWSPGGIQLLAGVTPDLTTLAKVLTGGLPGGAVAGRENIMRLLDPRAKSDTRQPPVMHKGTFNASSLVSSAAIAALTIVKTGDPQQIADNLAARLRAGMQRILDDHQLAATVYGDSSTFHLFFGRREITGLSSAQIRGVPKQVVSAFRFAIRRRGLDLMSYLGGVTSSAHTANDIDEALNIFDDAMKDLVASGILGRG